MANQKDINPELKRTIANIIERAWRHLPVEPDWTVFGGKEETAVLTSDYAEEAAQKVCDAIEWFARIDEADGLVRIC